MNLQMILLELLDPDPDQPRRECDEQEDKRLAVSIRDHSLLQPLIVFQLGDRFQVVDGHRRLKSLRMLRATEAPAIVLADRPDADTLLMTQLTANCLRSDMTPLDKARAYQRLMDSRGWNHTELATHLHVGKGSVTQCLSYLKLSSEAQTALQTGELAESTAYAIARAPDAATQQSMLESAKRGELTRDDAQKTVRKRSTKRSRTSRIVCPFSETTVTVASTPELGLDQLRAGVHQVWKECKLASGKHWDVPTLARVLSNDNRQRTGAVKQEELRDGR